MTVCKKRCKRACQRVSECWVYDRMSKRVCVRGCKMLREERRADVCDNVLCVGESVRRDVRGCEWSVRDRG